MADNIGWQSLDDFTATFEYWHEIDSRVGQLLYDSFTVDGSQLQVKNGPAQPMNSEGYLEYLVNAGRDRVTVETFEISRGERTSRTLGEFSSFVLAGKFLMSSEIAESIRHKVAPYADSPAFHLDDQGLNEGWQVDQGFGGAYPRRMYRKVGEPDQWYIGDARFPSTSHYLAMSYETLNRTLSVDVDPKLLPPVPPTSA